LTPPRSQATILFDVIEVIFIMLPYLFVVLAVAVRFMPHPWMFTPVTGSLLFFGSRGPRRWLWIPFVLLAASDVVLTKFVYVFPFTWDHYVTFAWYAAVLWLGTRLDAKTKWVPVIGAALASSVSFFVLSNFATWASWDMYPKNFGGLMACYAAALPFFRHALAGDLIFTTAMFATPIALHALSEAFRTHGDHAAAA
jgi:hypothetical protein